MVGTLGQGSRINTVTSAMLSDTMIVFDFETTGLSAITGGIVEIAALKIDAFGHTHDSFHMYVNPGMSIPPMATSIHGLTDMDVKDAPVIDIALREFLVWAGVTRIWWAYNASFDVQFLVESMRRCMMLPPMSFVVLDILQWVRKVWPGFSNHKLTTVSEMLRIYLPKSHMAMWDVVAASCILGRLYEEDQVYKHNPGDSLARVMKGRVTTAWKIVDSKMELVHL